MQGTFQISRKILPDSNLSWKFHIEYVALKRSRILVVIARLRHFVPLCTLLNIYRSLIFPISMSYGFNSNILPINMLYICWNCIFLNVRPASHVCLFRLISVISFTKVNEIHTHKTRSSSSDNCYIKSSILSLLKRLFFYIKLEILHNSCGIRSIVLLDFLNLLIRAACFCFHIILFSFL